MRLVADASESTVSVLLLRSLVSAAVHAGVDRAQFLEAAAIAPGTLEAADGRVSLAECFRVLNVARACTEDPAFGLHWAERLDSARLAPVSNLITCSGSLRQCLDALERFHRLIADQLGYEAHFEGDTVTLRVANLPWGNTAAEHTVCEMVVLGLHRLCSVFVHDRGAIRVSFAYAAPAYADEYARLFPGQVLFEQAFSGLVVDLGAAPQSALLEDAGVFAALQSVAEQRLLRMQSGTPYSVRLRQFLVEKGWKDHSKMSVAAEALGLSARSLRRRLSEEGLTYSAVTEEALSIVAKRLLRVGRLSIQEAAFEMGFSDTTTFHRAFRRWTGTTPSAYRKAQIMGSGAD
jgi:AraC-like DNA-binding protein